MRVHAIQTGAVQIKASQIVGRGQGLARRMAPLFDENWSDWLPVYAFAIEHRDGVILVDSGSNAGLKSLPRWHPYFRLAVRFEIEREQEAGPQLRALGIAPRDVKTVVLTHMHIDHDGGLADFTASRVLVSPGELKAASGFAGEIRGYLPKRWPRGFDPQPLALADEPYGPFAKSRRVTADGAVIAIPTPGHTRDHLSVAVDDGDACVILAGDASYSEANLIAGQSRWRQRRRDDRTGDVDETARPGGEPAGGLPAGPRSRLGRTVGASARRRKWRRARVVAIG